MTAGAGVPGAGPAGGSAGRSEGVGSAFDVLVIGTGAAGMAAALRAAELGAAVGIAESGEIGGTCVNVGCIPSKALIAMAAHRHTAREGFPGLPPCDGAVEWQAGQEAKRALVDELRSSKYVDVLAGEPRVTLLRGAARLLGGGRVAVGAVEHRAAKVVIATGASPAVPAIEGLDGVDALNSTTALALDALPASLVVVGGGAVGLELGQMFARAGAHVTVLERRSRVLSTEPPPASEAIRAFLEAEGLEVRTSVDVRRVAPTADGVRVHARGEAGESSVEAERLLVAVGARANVDAIGLDAAGVATDARGFVEVDAHMRTTNPDVYAAGDVTGGPPYVYVAAAGGRVAAEHALGRSEASLELTAVPRVTFTSPQVAAVGRSAAEASEAGLEIETRRLAMEHVPRALVEHDRRGWIEVVAERTTGRLVGVHAVAPHAGEIVGAATLPVRLGLTLDDVAGTLHPYLTWMEGLKLAVRAFEADVSKLSCCA